jgi:hypothetical protein
MQFRPPRADVSVRTTQQASQRSVRPGSRRNHPNEPPARTITPTPHPEDARWARRAGGLPGRRHRPGPGGAGSPFAANAFLCTGTATPAPRRSACALPVMGHRGDPGRNDRLVRRHDPHHPCPGTPSLGPPQSSSQPQNPTPTDQAEILSDPPHATVHEHQTGGRRSDARVGERDPQRLPHGITTRHVTRTASADRTGPAGCQRNGWPPEDSKLQRPHRRGQPIPAAAIGTATLPDSRRRGNLQGRPPGPHHVPLTPSQQFGTGSASTSLTIQAQLRPRGNCPHCRWPRHQRTPSAPSRRMSAVPLPLPRNRSECLFRVTSEVT